MMVRSRSTLPISALLLAWLLAVSGALAQTPMRLPVDAALLTVTDTQGAVKARFSVEIARSPDERSRGLMHRADLPADRAMLFIFDDEGPRAFWMHNTPLPLDIVYADGEGAVVSIAADTTPFSRTSIPSGAPARYVLEVHAGTAARLGISVGDLLAHPAIDR